MTSGLLLSDAECAKIHATIALLESQRDEARSKKLRLEFCLSAIIEVVKKYNDPDVQSCIDMIHVALGGRQIPIKSRAPVLVIDNDKVPA